MNSASFLGLRVGDVAPALPCRVLALLCWMVLAALLRAQSPAIDANAVEDVADVAQQIPSSIESASHAVVRIKRGTEYASSGVIVSEDGFVVWSGAAHPAPDLSVALPSGESVAATNLGFSQEWQVGVLKLQGDRKWEHAPWGTTAKSMPGDPCFEVGYRAIEGKKGEFTASPVIRRGKLRLVSPAHWLATTLTPTHFEYGAGTFDAEGKLLGISVPGVSTKHHLSTAVEIFTSQWNDFTDGKNLDWARYPPSKQSLFQNLAAPDQLDRSRYVRRADAPGWKDVNGPDAIDEDAFGLARKAAAATTVRIRVRSNGEPQVGKSQAWSGVVVSADGLIATCAHTLQLPGEELVVVLPDGRQVSAQALGTNWVSDVGLVKITEAGPWNYAELGDSSVIAPGGAVLCSGFPTPDVDPLPPVTMAILPLQVTPYVGWSRQLMFAPSLELPGGSSGGGVFDQNGRLVAIYIGPGGGHRIEMLRAQQDQLKQEQQ